jgi:opacity protein-like surface antigen
MKRILAAAALAVLFAAPALGQKSDKGAGGGDAVKSTLVALEKQAWAAWSKKDANFFRTFLAEDAVNNGRGGVENKEQIIRDVADSKCEVKGYALDDGSFKVTMLDADAAILTYRATQDFVCDGKPGPTPVWVSAVYVRRGGKWKNMLYHETQAEK